MGFSLELMNYKLTRQDLESQCTDNNLHVMSAGGNPGREILAS